MKNLFSCLVGAFLAFCGPVSAVDPASFDLSYLPVNQVISLYYKEVSKRPYVVCDDILKDSRLVSVRAAGRLLDGPAFDALLSAYGYEAVTHGGVALVCLKKPGAVVADDAVVPFFYRVKYRDTAYLVDLLSPLVKGVFANKRSSAGAFSVGGAGVSAAGGAPDVSSAAPQASYSSSKGDEHILFSGSPVEVAKLRSLLDQLDTPIGEVVFKAYMYEVGKNSSDASALELVLTALRGKVQISTAADVVGNLVRLRTGSVDLVASALSTDGRFKVVTAPFVRLMSGKTARFVSGGQQSVLGAIVTNQNGSQQQSYERVESGTILEVSPVVRGEIVDVNLFQQVSSFVNTDAGRSGQPTLNKRELRTALSMVDGEVVVLAGLNESKDDNASSGLRFLPFALSKSSGARSSELVLILEMKRI